MLPLPLSAVDDRGTEERKLNTASQSCKRRRADEGGISSGHREEDKEKGEYVAANGGGKHLYRVGSALVNVLR